MNSKYKTFPSQFDKFCFGLKRKRKTCQFPSLVAYLLFYSTNGIEDRQKSNSNALGVYEKLQRAYKTTVQDKQNRKKKKEKKTVISEAMEKYQTEGKKTR